MKKLVNGIQVEMTDQEIAEMEESRVSGQQKALRNAYKALRQEAYGSIEEQLDFIVKNGLEAYTKRNLDIKRQFPKPADV